MLDAWSTFRRHRLMRRLDSPDVDVRKRTLRRLADEGAPAASDEPLVEKLLDLTIGPVAADRRESRYTLERIGVRGRVIFSHLLRQLDQPDIREPQDGGAKLCWVSDLLAHRARPRGVTPLLRSFHRFVDRALDDYVDPSGMPTPGGHLAESGQIFAEEGSAGEIFDHLQSMRDVPACAEAFVRSDLPPKQQTIDRYAAILQPDADPSRSRILAAIAAGQTDSRALFERLRELQNASRQSARVFLDAPRGARGARGAAPRAVRFSDAIDRSVAGMQARTLR